jgi:hypothetical protein
MTRCWPRSSPAGAIRAHKEHIASGVFEAILSDGVESGEFDRVDPRETSPLRSLRWHFCHPVLVAQYLQDQQDPKATPAPVRFLSRAP